MDLFLGMPVARGGERLGVVTGLDLDPSGRCLVGLLVDNDASSRHRRPTAIDLRRTPVREAFPDSLILELAEPLEPGEEPHPPAPAPGDGLRVGARSIVESMDGHHLGRVWALRCSGPDHHLVAVGFHSTLHRGQTWAPFAGMSPAPHRTQETGPTIEVGVTREQARHLPRVSTHSPTFPMWE